MHQRHPNALGNYLGDALRRLGHNVTWVGESAIWGQPGYQPYVDLVELLGKEAAYYDLAIATDDNWLPHLQRGWERLPFPTALVAYDYYDHSLNRACYEPVLPLFDHIFLLNFDAVQLAASRHPSAHWCPPAIDPAAFKEIKAGRTLDIGIVGGNSPNFPRRFKRLGKIAARYKTNDVWRYYPRHEIPEVYGRSKIVVNLGADGIKTLSYRVFEGMACGALVVCEETDSGLDRLFKQGEHLVVFRDDEEMYRLIDYYLAHDAEREQIARAGQSLVCAQHTWDGRMKTLLDVVAAAGSKLTAPARHMPEVEIQRLYAHAYMRRLKIDPIFGLFGDEILPLWVWPLVSRALLGRIGFRRRLRRWRAQRQRPHLTPSQSEVDRFV